MDALMNWNNGPALYGNVANLALSEKDGPFVKITPTAAQNVILPEARVGRMLHIVNGAAGAYTLTVKNQADATIETIEQDREVILYVDRTTLAWALYRKAIITLT